MGMFDSVYAPCPHCGHRREFQSKAGACELASYEAHNAPAVILADLAGEHRVECKECGLTWILKIDPLFDISAILIGKVKRPKP